MSYFFLFLFNTDEFSGIFMCTNIIGTFYVGLIYHLSKCKFQKLQNAINIILTASSHVSIITVESGDHVEGAALINATN